MISTEYAKKVFNYINDFMLFILVIWHSSWEECNIAIHISQLSFAIFW